MISAMIGQARQRHYLVFLTDAMQCLSAVFSQLNQTCKDVIRNDLGEPMSHLFIWDTAIGETSLFECDIAKKLKEHDEARYKIRKRKRESSQYRYEHMTIS